MATEHDASEYGTHIADDYDAIYGEVWDTEAAVDRLAQLAAGGPVLEFGIGTGRLALPLVERGLEVHGIDGSAEMLDLLARKPRGREIRSAVGDFTTTRMPREFSLVVLAVNTIYAVPDQGAQVRCFENAAAHLRPGGRFVVEGWIPEAGLEPGFGIRPRRLGGGHVGLVVADHDPIAQVLATQQVVLGGPTGVRVFPVVHRYAWPAELDLMARIAGMDLEVRWADWRGTAITPTSENHVSVYRRSA